MECGSCVRFYRVVRLTFTAPAKTARRPHTMQKGLHMPIDLPVPGTSGFTIKKSRHILSGAGEISFDLVAQPGSDVFAALATNSPFPPRRIQLEEIAVKVAGEKTVPLGSPKGTVSFSGKASAYEGLSVVDSAADVVALLVRDQINDDLAKGIGLSKSDASKSLPDRF